MVVIFLLWKRDQRQQLVAPQRWRRPSELCGMFRQTKVLPKRDANSPLTPEQLMLNTHV